jgi:hypothetical protein
MASWDVTGVWAGEYWYDFNVQFPVLPPRTSFDLVVRQGWFGRFRGAAQDAQVGGHPAEAAVAGRVTRRGMRFLKRYPAAYAWAGDRMAPLGEQIWTDHGVRLDADPTPSPIWYRGEYDPATETVRGTWAIRPQLVQCWSDGQPVALDMPGCSGEWRMERQPG